MSIAKDLKDDYSISYQEYKSHWYYDKTGKVLGIKASKEVGERLRIFRESLKDGSGNSISQSQLAIKLGLTPSYISKLETGKKNISIKIVDMLNNYFELDSDWLAHGIFDQVDKMAKEFFESDIGYIEYRLGKIMERIGSYYDKHLLLESTTDTTPYSFEKIMSVYANYLFFEEEIDIDRYIIVSKEEPNFYIDVLLTLYKTLLVKIKEDIFEIKTHKNELKSFGFYSHKTEGLYNDSREIKNKLKYTLTECEKKKELIKHNINHLKNSLNTYKNDCSQIDIWYGDLEIKDKLMARYLLNEYKKSPLIKKQIF